MKRIACRNGGMISAPTTSALAVLHELSGCAAHCAHRDGRCADPHRDSRPAQMQDAREFVSSFDRPNIRYLITGVDERANCAFLREHAASRASSTAVARKKLTRPPTGSMPR